MSFVLVEDMDFGTVETAVYGYVNFCQGPDFYEFRMSPEAARPFMEKIDKALAGPCRWGAEKAGPSGAAVGSGHLSGGGRG